MNPGPAERMPTPNSLELLIDLDWDKGRESGSNGAQNTIVEHLRLLVPAEAKSAWIQAEMLTWDPWLRQQKGCVGRKLLWDSTRQEGVILIHWASREDWTAIPESAVTSIQQEFETVAKQILGLPAHSSTPFPLIYSGETSP